MSDAVETIAWTGVPPWHQLGKEVSQDLSPDQMQKEAALDWYVEKIPLRYEFDGQKIESEQFALARSSDGLMLDVVKSKNWEPVQNHQAFKFFERFVKHNRMSMEVAGSLRDGKFVFVLAKMNQEFHVGSGTEDQTDGYLLFTNPHQYGRAVDIRLTPIRVVCMNTLQLALTTASNAMVKYNHRHKFDVYEAQSVFQAFLATFDEYRDTARFLADKRYDEQALQRYFDVCFPYIPNIHTRTPQRDRPSANAERAFRIVETQPGAGHSPGTWWNALNAVTYLTDHELGKSPETRLQSAWYGKGEQRKRQALTLAVEYAKAA